MTAPKKTVGTEKPKYTRKREAMSPVDRVNNQPYDIDVIPEPTHPTKTSRAINKLVVAAMVLVFAALIVLFHWAIVDENVLVVKNSPFPVRTIREHPTANGVVLLNVDLCKNTDAKGSVRTSFVSETREVFLPLAEENIPKGCFNRELPVLIPKDLAPDTYKIKFRVTYDLNPLKKGIVDEFESKEFTVDPVTQ